MRNLFVILSFMIYYCGNAYIQNAVLRCEDMPIVFYDNPNCMGHTAVIEDNEDACFNVEIIDKTKNMYLVNVFDAFTDNYDCVATGWIRKENVGVYGWTWDKYGVPYEQLFKQPDKTSEYQLAPACSASMILLDYTDDGDFVKVKYSYNDTVYIGWIDQYCPDCNAGCN